MRTTTVFLWRLSSAIIFSQWFDHINVAIQQLMVWKNLSYKTSHKLSCYKQAGGGNELQRIINNPQLRTYKRIKEISRNIQETTWKKYVNHWGKIFQRRNFEMFWLSQRFSLEIWNQLKSLKSSLVYAINPLEFDTSDGSFSLIWSCFSQQFSFGTTRGCI